MIARLLGIRIFDVEVSSHCNLRCRFCPRDEIPAKGFMSRETFERFLDWVPLRATDNLAFVGMGEPTLNPLLPEFIRRAKARYPKTITWVTSNGTRLKDGMVPRLLDAGLDILDVSFNGLDAESYEATMCGASFEKTLANLESARAEIERRGSRTRLQVNFVVTADNPSRVEATKAFWRARGIDRFRLQRMHNRGGTVAVEGMRDVEASGLGGRTCSLFETMSFVSWTGDVYYCSHDTRRHHPLGNISREPWESIHQRKRTIQRMRCRPEMCGACTDPLRHDLGAQIGRQVRAELGERARRTLRSLLGRPRIVPDLPPGARLDGEACGGGA